QFHHPNVKWPASHNRNAPRKNRPKVKAFFTLEFSSGTPNHFHTCSESVSPFCLLKSATASTTTNATIQPIQATVNHFLLTGGLLLVPVDDLEAELRGHVVFQAGSR